MYLILESRMAIGGRTERLVNFYSLCPLVAQGIYLLLERLKFPTYRRLLKRIQLLHAAANPAKAAQLPLGAIAMLGICSEHTSAFCMAAPSPAALKYHRLRLRLARLQVLPGSAVGARDRTVLATYAFYIRRPFPACLILAASASRGRRSGVHRCQPHRSGLREGLHQPQDAGAVRWPELPLRCGETALVLELWPPVLQQMPLARAFCLLAEAADRILV